MYRILVGEEVKRRGVWRWTVDGTSLSGVSRQPLLDACREIKRTTLDTSQPAGLFWPGKDSPSLTARTVEEAAALTVAEGQKDTPHFVKYREFDRSRLQSDADTDTDTDTDADSPPSAID